MQDLRGRSRVGVGLLLLGLLAVAFLLSPLSPHATSGVVVAPLGPGQPITVQVDDRGGRRTARLSSGPDEDLAAQSVGARVPVLTYPGGRVGYDSGRLRPTLWILSALALAAGGAIGGRRRHRLHQGRPA